MQTHKLTLDQAVGSELAQQVRDAKEDTLKTLEDESVRITKEIIIIHMTKSFGGGYHLGSDTIKKIHNELDHLQIRGNLSISTEMVVEDGYRELAVHVEYWGFNYKDQCYCNQSFFLDNIELG